LLCVEVLEYELNRYDKLKSQIVSAPRESKTPKIPTPSKLPVPRSAPITSKIVRSQIPVSASTNSDSRRHSASIENMKQTVKGLYNFKYFFMYTLYTVSKLVLCNL
jgi:hypothetical protein